MTMNDDQCQSDNGIGRMPPINVDAQCYEQAPLLHHKRCIALPPYSRYYVNGVLSDHRQGSESLPEASSEWTMVRSALASHRL
jgi:hypothetical protein